MGSFLSGCERYTVDGLIWLVLDSTVQQWRLVGNEMGR